MKALIISLSVRGSFPIHLQNPVDGFEGDKSTHCGYSLVCITYLISGFHRMIIPANVFHSVIFYVLLYCKAATISMMIIYCVCAKHHTKSFLWLTSHHLYVDIKIPAVGKWFQMKHPGCLFKTRHLQGHYVQCATQILKNNPRWCSENFWWDSFEVFSTHIFLRIPQK